MRIDGYYSLSANFALAPITKHNHLLFHIWQMKKNWSLERTNNLSELTQKVAKQSSDSWLTPKYHSTKRSVKEVLDLWAHFSTGRHFKVNTKTKTHAPTATHLEIHSIFVWKFHYSLKLKKLMTASVNENGEQLKLFYMTGAKWYTHFGKQFGSFL